MRCSAPPTAASSARRSAAERCIPLVDETLVEVSLDGQDMPPPFAVGSQDTITIGSASKTFWGGLRIGWIRAPRSLVRPLVESRARSTSGRRRWSNWCWPNCSTEPR